ARVYASDARGGNSGYSNTVHFTLRADGVPAAPPIAGVFSQQCQGVTLHAAPPSIAVGNVEDPDGEAVTLELQVLDFAADTLLLDVTQSESLAAATTAMDTSTMRWTEDAHYRVRARAGDGTAWSGWNTCAF